MSIDIHASTIEELSKFIPLRLDSTERSLLKVLESALDVSEYTDVVDVTFSHLKKSKTSRMMSSLVDTLNITEGLIISTNLSQGEAMFGGKNHDDNISFYATIFEIGRRYKMMNPGKMRDSYGKLIYMLMDTESATQFSEYKFVKPIKTVGRLVNKNELQELLKDPSVTIATECIVDGGNMEDFRARLARKAGALSELRVRHGEGDKKREAMIERCVDSIGDYRAFLEANVGPVQTALNHLLNNFKQDGPSHDLSDLTLRPKAGGTRSMFGSSNYGSYSYSGFSYGGNSLGYRNRGACLSHSHSTQYMFVLQSLTLWKEIMQRLPLLWFAADDDMINQAYRLCDTGQGYNRVQQCPQVRDIMSSILRRTQGMFNHQWVGLSVVHLGDRDVPNALMFIDKYTQIPRILSVLNSCIASLPALNQVPALEKYIVEEWGGLEGLRYQILSDYFKHGFDGSGDDGGSCIDGRLTSTWNWCSELVKKPYYAVFMFSGFQGFDAFENQQE